MKPCALRCSQEESTLPWELQPGGGRGTGRKTLHEGQREVTAPATCEAGRARGLRGAPATTRCLPFAIHGGLLLTP